MAKRVLSLLITVMMLAGVLVFNAAAVGNPTQTWKFGGAAAIDGQDGTAQGQNGWYYMWSPETNKAGNLDVTKIKECVMSETGSAKFPYLSSGKGWIPDIYTGDDYKGGTDWKNWWYQSSDGTMNPSVVDAPYATAVLGWKAQSSGIFKINVKYTAGGQTTLWEGVIYPSSGDGVTVSAYAKNEKKYSKATTLGQLQPVDESGNPVGNKQAGAALDKDQTFEVSAMLKEGEMFYITVDPNANGGEDIASFEVNIEKTGSYVDNQRVWGFGSSAIAGQNGSVQGQNGWYYMWSPETNKAGNLDVTKIKECVMSETGSAKFPYLSSGKGWIPDIYTGDDYKGGTDWKNWWYQDSDGTMNPSVVDAPYATAVLGWKVPKSGKYKFDGKYTAGGQTTLWEGVIYPSSGDGVTVSAFAKGEKKYSKATTLGQLQPVDESGNPVGNKQAGAALDKDQTFTFTADLKAGDMVYFTVDPNANGGEDIANLFVTAEALEFEQPSTPSEANNSQGSNNNNNKNPATDDNIGVFALITLVVAAGAACSVKFINAEK